MQSDPCPPPLPATKVVFKDGRVFAQNRFVSTGVWDPNAPEGQGSAGARRGWTPRPGGWLKNAFRLPGNPVNTSVMVKGGKLYALCEGGKPVEMDPVTLETLGERDLGGLKVNAAQGRRSCELFSTPVGSPADARRRLKMRTIRRWLGVFLGKPGLEDRGQDESCRMRRDKMQR